MLCDSSKWATEYAQICALEAFTPDSVPRYIHNKNQMTLLSDGFTFQTC